MTGFSATTASRDEGLRVLAAAPYSLLTTFRRDGSPVGVPIWHAVADGKVYMFTEARSWKVKRLRRNPHIEITTCDWRGKLDGGATWTGSGRVVNGPAVVAKAYKALDAKYGWQKWITDALSRLAGRYDGRAILEIELDG
jgi:PPOX class probable F420-dependent enzyme